MELLLILLDELWLELLLELLELLLSLLELQLELLELLLTLLELSLLLEELGFRLLDGVGEFEDHDELGNEDDDGLLKLLDDMHFTPLQMVWLN